jgi:hypothetical protein
MFKLIRDIEKEVIDSFDQNARMWSGTGGYGRAEVVEIRVEKLEKCIAHLFDFIAKRMCLTDEEIIELTDF